eukprot:CAMPEP_0194202556 /NCGR_PEP_ID=MMETSP0156-20130528/2545_1 /TAXON_ID=33649 /ORGANISM="Thalassionema nitzschioides, Strain L26-B" /LENGTH=512 /DNA_ID=CAMNT_0038928075 /DNA_START=203 /DNA_END=1741 /DNA_ORIENTATION=+
MSVLSSLRFCMLYALRQPSVLFVVGATIGIVFYHALVVRTSSGSGCSNNVKESGTLLAQLLPQPRRYPSPLVKQQQHLLSSSKPMFVNASTREHTYFMPCGKNCHAFQRAVRSVGWIKLNSAENARLVFTDMNKEANEGKEKFQRPELEAWQRYNHLPNRQNFTTRELFLDTINAHIQRDDPEFDFLPPTYRMHQTSERRIFERNIKEDGKHAYWMYWNRDLKTTFVNSKQAKDVIKLHDEGEAKQRNYMTRYTCNPMTWSDGNTFMIRVFWLAASVDPVLVYYQDGYGRIGYNQTYPQKLQWDYKAVTMEEVEEYLESKSPDLIIHVRNQIKASLASLVNVFHQHTNAFVPSSDREDGFELFATDFVISQDTYQVELYLPSPYSDTLTGNPYSFTMEDYYFLVQKNHELFYSTMLILTELWDKQMQRQDQLVLQQTGQYQMIYAATESFKYKFEYATKKKRRKKLLSSCKVVHSKAVPASQRVKQRKRSKAESTIQDILSSDDGGEESEIQ